MVLWALARVDENFQQKILFSNPPTKAGGLKLWWEAMNTLITFPETKKVDSECSLYAI